MKKFEKLKGFVFGVLVTILVCTTIIPAFAASIEAAFNSINIKINGQQVAAVGQTYTLDNGTVVPYSIVYEGTTYLPLRKMGELFGKDILWDGATQTASVNDKGYVEPTSTPAPAPNPTPAPAPTPTRQVQPAASFSSDPVKALQQVAEYLIDGYNYNNRGKPIHVQTTASFGQPAEDYWVYTYAKMDSAYEYDVSVTTSLVSPYEGIVTYTLYTYTSKVHRNSESEALSESDFNVNGSNKHTHKYAFQDGKWVVVQRQWHSDFLDIDYECTLDWCKETFLNSNMR